MYKEPVREEISYEEDLFEEEEKEEVAVKDSRLQRANKRLSGKLQLFFSLMFALLVGAMVYIRMNYILSSEENVLSIVVMVISAITGAVALIGGFKDMKKTAPKTGAESQDEDEDDYADDFDEEDSFFEAKEPVVENVHRTRRVSEETSSFAPKSKPEGATVVLDHDRSGELALFSRNLDKTVRIPLESLPITIGKMEECVDMKLSDPSVSRMHCRIEEKSGRAFVRDLGSTNGTFRNGLKLKPQESVMIEEGDEIRIGRVCFDCR